MNNTKEVIMMIYRDLCSQHTFIHRIKGDDASLRELEKVLEDTSVKIWTIVNKRSYVE
jgi:hypothetical protein